MDYPNSSSVSEDTFSPVVSEEYEPSRRDLSSSWLRQMNVAQWVERYRDLIRHVQTVEDPSTVDQLSLKLNAWQQPFAQAGRRLAQQELILKNKLAQYARSLISEA